MGAAQAAKPPCQQMDRGGVGDRADEAESEDGGGGSRPEASPATSVSIWQEKIVGLRFPNSRCGF